MKKNEIKLLIYTGHKSNVEWQFIEILRQNLVFLKHAIFVNRNEENNNSV